MEKFSEKAHEYQYTAIKWQLQHPESVLKLDMGLGKTVITLCSIKKLIADGKLKGVLIVAPLKVAAVGWSNDAAKWAETSSLTFSTILGNKDRRIYAMKRKADIYTTNYENLEWVLKMMWLHIKNKKKPPFDGIVFDELSMMKSHKSKRNKAVRMMLDNFKWKTGLTGTFASNGYADTYGQMLCIDNGKRLGLTETAFRKRFFKPKTNIFNKTQFYEKWEQLDDTPKMIAEALKDCVLVMEAKDYNPLPDTIFNDVYVEFEEDVQEKYNQLEDEFFFELENGDQLNVTSQAALMNKALQFSNGTVYVDKDAKAFEVIHDEKLDALERIINETEGPILCAYAFRSDAQRIMAKFKHLHPVNFTEQKGERNQKKVLKDWKDGKIKLLIGHPRSMGYGVDGLQHAGRTIVWFGLTWSLADYLQFNARIKRQGQPHPVICHRILVRNTFDQAQHDALERKESVEQGLTSELTNSEIRASLLEYRRKKTKM